MSDSAVKTIQQVVTTEGEACSAVGTENVWVGYGPKEQFAFPVGNNDVMPLTSGKKYFAELIAEIDKAQDEIYIAGWQVSWDGLLAPGVRLFDLLLKAAKRPNVKIYVMPWDDLPPVQTHDDQTKVVLESINSIVGSTKVIVELAAGHADKSAGFFSHHQKQVIIDRKVAFLGGIDIAHGRYDDDHYNLHANADGREVLNRYNGCVAWVGKVEGKTVDPDAMKGMVDSYARVPFMKSSKTNAQIHLEEIQAGAWQVPYVEQKLGSIAGSKVSPRTESNTASDIALDPKTQPRQPWQDVHCKMTGPVVSDLTKNFVMRWNSLGTKKVLTMPEPNSQSVDKKCIVQVLRSMSLDSRKLEYTALPADQKDKQAAPQKAQDDIQKAMCTIIEKAQHFIYIENQFFVSAFGELAGYPNAGPSAVPEEGPAKAILDGSYSSVYATRIMPGDADGLPKNQVVATLSRKLDEVIRRKNKQPFHVYITLPVHSEGTLNNGACIAQIHWTMQTLVFGTHSLLNSIRRSIRAREIFDKNSEDNWRRVYAKDNEEYLDIPIEKCFEYVTLLNLRNWDVLGTGANQRYVTEQVYVHSKLLIVDDRYAILGSANINDRSLAGGRDSEIAVLVVDTANKDCDLNQSGATVPTRQFARDLRQQIWRKIFGITAGGDKAATELSQAVLYPAAPASWKAIQQRAKQNTDLYEAAFDWIPRSLDPNDNSRKRPSSLWPRWDKKIEMDSAEKRKAIENEIALLQKEKMQAPDKKIAELSKSIAQKKSQINQLPKALSRPMPFEPDFWKTPQHNPAAAADLKNVKGFITLLPIRWTEGENNRIPYHSMLVTQADPPIGAPKVYMAVNDTAPIESVKMTS
jgi:phospholipase D1/2